MLRGHLWKKADEGHNANILAAIRSLATDAISALPPQPVLSIAELTYGNSLNFLEAGIEQNDILEAMDIATSNWFQLASHFPFLIAAMSRIPAPILKLFIPFPR